MQSAVTASANSIYSGGSLGLNVQGQGMTVSVWDSGPILDTHVEFPNAKVTTLDFSATSDHGTHVMGTILAKGINQNARGLAFDANGLSYDWTNDYSEMTVAAASGLLVSNHSYWIGSGLSEWILGAYDSRAQQMDQIAYAAPFYLPVVAAGNDRNNTTNPIVNTHLQNKYGYDIIRGMQNAKNSLAVGAVNNVSNYMDESSVTMSSFSSWGPTDDGRIKPEIVAKGVSVYSTVADSDTSYGFKQGTSMASPAISGVCLLLQQYYLSLNTSYMRASTLKGILLHSAKEAGYFYGPDYEYGWGLVDVKSAADIITKKNQALSVIEELPLSNGQVYTKTFTVSNPSNVKVSICWTDKPAPSGLVNSGTVDPNVSYLVNDLDLKVTKTGNDYFPWSLDVNQPYAAPTRTTTNNVDIFERVDIDNAVGTYTITVTHKGNIGTGQNFSLIISGLNLSLSNDEFSKDGLSIYPNPAENLLNIQSDFDFINAKVKIFDVSGKIVYSNNDFKDNIIDISNLLKGFYILEINNENKILTKKFIKK
ncbi:MAG: S8 family serine peptidase [Flavobacterium sp.]|nr:S8 family serine peptidase [Flavobacterium sp.]